jgi:putative endonuclease
MYFVYIVECADSTLYIGSTNDIEKRILSHNTSKVGAKYTRGRRPVILKYYESFETKSEALKREIEIKKFTRTQKNFLITDQERQLKKCKKK